ncbi:MAG: hypothetical protein A2X49_15635 [Lentisphaerae bacterium GWF2_52_8]|nr:MAG: hypothetical protein A2X49_15635 [Lentisphaerae bacterium GWF2_52_8]
MAEKIKCGIIGCGVISPAHAESYQMQENVELVWACDIVEEKARSLAEKFGIPKVCGDYRRVLEDSELSCVSVCTDHASHAPISVAALEAGKHVICEKALAASTEGLENMMDAHERHPELVFAGVFQHRFDRSHQHLRKLIEEGVFGTLLYADLRVLCLRTKEYYRADKWRGTWDEEGGSVLINQAIHFIDIMQWVMGGVESVSAHYENRARRDCIETEDTATASLRFRSGALGSISATSASNIPWEANLCFCGEAGTLEICCGKIIRLDFKDKSLEERIRKDFAALQEAPALASAKQYYGSSHPAQIADFIDAVRSGRAPFVTAKDARAAVDLVLAIYRSQNSGRCIEL